MDRNRRELLRQKMRKALASEITSACPISDLIEAMAEGLLRGKQKRDLQAHLNECPTCAARLSPRWKRLAFVRHCHHHPWRTAWNYLRGKMTADEREDFLDHLRRCLSCSWRVELLKFIPLVALRPACSAGQVDVSYASTSAVNVPMTGVVRRLAVAYALSACCLLLLVGSTAYHAGMDLGMRLDPKIKIEGGSQVNSQPLRVQEILSVLFAPQKDKAQLESLLGEAELLLRENSAVKRSPEFHYVLSLRYKDLAGLETTREQRQRYLQCSEGERREAIRLGFPSEK